MKLPRIDYVLVALVFILGFTACYILRDNEDRRVPKYIEIIKDGYVKGYAETDLETAEIVRINNAKSPGMFLAFPIYAERGELKWLTT